ncbi:MAG TPA: DHH family phosphoesterase [Candidatus Acidoferrales bacterium]|nr:DHH family phosphoesterase [Candidatus Acidoferrales bacterium]
MRVRVCFHDKCFDGAASAAIFSRFYRERIHSDAQFCFTGMTHKASRPFEEGTFDGDENAIVDFKFSSSPKLTWWFDHHQSAFLTLEDAAAFRQDHSGKKFYDPTYKSCTKFLATVASEKFGFDARPLEELIHWGDIIDGAQFESSEAAVAMREPAMQLALVIEAAPEADLVPRLIPEMAARPLAEMVKLPMVTKHLEPLLKRHRKSIGILKERADARDGVIYFDVSDLDLEGYNKFIPYFLFPDFLYTVGVSASPTRAKVSVGTNPWKEPPKEVNLASLCEKYGGGGHARVAAISLAPEDLPRARQVAQEIAATLRGGSGGGRK